MGVNTRQACFRDARVSSPIKRMGRGGEGWGRHCFLPEDFAPCFNVLNTKAKFYNMLSFFFFFFFFFFHFLFTASLNKSVRNEYHIKDI